MWSRCVALDEFPEWGREAGLWERIQAEGIVVRGLGICELKHYVGERVSGGC
ncbi:MAG: hypothetical protein H5T86_00140 [Armatimonadetes bacterium]|nr:hypothetical protein [Armatimonadota bacterium]